jgi:hypothetical protein
MFFRRSQRLLAIHSSPVGRALWKWATGENEITSKGMARAGQVTGIGRGLVAVALNVDDPAGWRALSRVALAVSGAAGKWFADKAAERAVYFGEETIRNSLIH